ncbi:MAG: FliI/YscN family ATPase [Candidatus Latescibacterota bacterium]
MDREALLQVVAQTDPRVRYGKVSELVGLVIESQGPGEVAPGEICLLGEREPGPVRAEVVGYRDRRVLLMPLGEVGSIRPGTAVFPTRGSLRVPVGPSLQGRILDGLGRPQDRAGPLHAQEMRSIHGPPPDPLTRRRVRQALGTGVRAIDGMITCGRGQRMGIFSGSGVGKSTLLGMIARHSEADVNVIGLVGERGKEVLDFIEDSLGQEGLRRSVVVVATSDQPALIRLKAAFVATTVAEYFRDQGKDVMLMMDSLTRVAMAQREIGLAAGEPPTTRGYTPSVFALLPRLLERVGATQVGSITGLYTVLVEGDDMDEPIADASRAILDGHMVLSRRLASRGHYPPVDVMESVSRAMRDVVSPAHWERALEVKSLLAAHAQAEDLINIGAYARGSNPRIDRALQFIAVINEFLQQDTESAAGLEEHVQRFMGLLAEPPPPPPPPRRRGR